MIMKKVLILSLCAVLCAALTSCEKEKSGVYNPKKKIQKIYYENNGEKVLDQVWNWNDKTLSSIDYYYNGTVSGSDIYSYDSENRIVRITEDDETLDFVYENDRIKTINYSWDGDLEESYNMIYANDKLSRIEWVVYESLLFKSGHERKLNPMARLIPQAGDVLEKQLQKLHSQQKGDEKLILELTWEGKNVSRIFAYVEDYPGETMDASFTYDNKINPLKGWASFWFDCVIGLWDDESFTYTNTGNVLTAVYNYSGGEEMEYNYSIATDYTYEYDGKYPVKVTAVEKGDNRPYVRYYEY
jgi:hypothetical protein